MLNIEGMQMKLRELKNKTELIKTKMKSAMQIIYDALNQGQHKQIVKNEAFIALFDIYEV